MSTLEEGQILAARYTLVRRLADRGATELWLARDGASGEAKLLKLAVPGRVDSDAALRRLLHGGRIQLGLRHANLLACEQVDAGPPAFAVYPYLARGDLSGLRGRPASEVLPVLAGVADGIEALHRQGLVHGDLKPANVLLSDEGRPLVTDLGLATPIGESPASVGGSPFSSSPQQLAGEPASVADDVYGFGAFAYELLSGYPPFYPDPSPERVNLEPPKPLAARSNVPAGLARLVMGCLEKDPARRPRDFSVLSRELAALEVAAQQPAEGLPGPRVELRPPREPAPAIEPQWRRRDLQGP
ncbi:MAG TPA: serine/threonine-protein kinase, partial [Steroidobacteraceae bacterium]|nr:serine/threonine-protein kinase [Steroidobacteraceae bacterium]